MYYMFSKFNKILKQKQQANSFFPYIFIYARLVLGHYPVPITVCKAVAVNRHNVSLKQLFESNYLQIGGNRVTL